jgi:hypothetical protein
MRLRELHAQGIDRVRLPFWNEFAYAVQDDGPWLTVYDVNAGVGSGEPIKVLIHDAERRWDWEPAPSEGEHE